MDQYHAPVSPSNRPDSAYNASGGIPWWENRSYLARIARSVGIPDMWVEDAVQEILISLLSTSTPTKRVARFKAIDFARWLMGRSGLGQKRHYVELDENLATTAPFDAVEEIADINDKLAELAPRELESIRGAVDGEQYGKGTQTSEHSIRYRARTKLRRAI